MHDLDGDLLAERPLLSCVRYNVQLESRWLEENLGVEIGPGKVKGLKEMDRPGNMQELVDLGALASDRQIEDTHFPAGFDLGA